MENENIEQMGADNGDKKPMSVTLIVIIVVIIAIIAGVYFWLPSSISLDESDTAKKLQEDQTLVDQISESVNTDNPASNVPQTNVFKTETNPFKDDGFKNPFE